MGVNERLWLGDAFCLVMINSCGKWFSREENHLVGKKTRSLSKLWNGSGWGEGKFEFGVFSND